MAAHAFKGASASIGAFDLSKILEYAQKNPDDLSEKKEITLLAIKQEFALVSDFIHEESLEK
jgi:HPt (histidine-containing phosphotransfer) domain-containing protein